MPDNIEKTTGISKKQKLQILGKRFMDWSVLAIYWLGTPLNRSTAKRWLDILLLAICGAVANLLISPILLKISEGADWMVNRLWRQMEIIVGTQRCTLMEWLNFAILVVIASLAMVPLVRLGALRLGHFWTFGFYPPAWLSAILASLVLSFGLIPDGKSSSELWLIAGLVLASSAVLVLLLLWIFETKPPKRRKKSKVNVKLKRPPTKEETLKKFIENPETELIPWLEDNEPISDPSDDLFESHKDARKIAEHILSPKLGSIGLNGPWGSGKSSVLNIAEYFLKHDKEFRSLHRKQWLLSRRGKRWSERWSMPRILIGRVKAWGFSKEGAASVILTSAIDELEKHVDCLSVRCLPNDYLQAIKGVSPSWFHAPLALAWPSNPEDQLERLDFVLTAINARLVIFVEDMDRNVESISQGNRNCLSEVESLLDRMKMVERVSFVLVISKGEK